MTTLPERVAGEVKNTLLTLQHSNIIDYFEPPLIVERKCEDQVTDLFTLSWPNHVSGGFQAQSFFGRVKQYLEVLKARAFICIFPDCSIIRASFVFKSQRLVNHSLQYWPCPVEVRKEALIESGHVEVVEDNLTGVNSIDKMVLRTPIRFDFDVENDSPSHPRSHFHFQDSECRFPISRPICFNTFMKFVFRVCYPDIFLSPIVQNLEEYSIVSERFDCKIIEEKIPLLLI